MARTRLNPRLVKLNRTHTIEEISRLYGLNRESVRRWVRSGELVPIDEGRPILIAGATLREFLTTRRAAKKQPTPPGRLYCFGCRAPQTPALGMADFQPAQAQGTGNLRAICAVCGSIMNRRAQWAAVPSILPDVEVRVVGRERRIAERPSPSLNVAFKEDATQ